MKNFLFTLLLSAFLFPVLQSCSDDSAPAPAPNQQDTTNNTEPGNSELLMRKWSVEEAYVNGSTPDASSKGLSVEFKEMGVYTLFLKDGSTFDGTWEFIESETKIDIDKNGQYPQTWTIGTLDKTTLDVTFVSPFTQQNARWVMK